MWTCYYPSLVWFFPSFYYSHIKALEDDKGNIIKCRFIRPKEEGIESVIKIEDGKKKSKNKAKKKK